jgi:hypothetical protein
VESRHHQHTCAALCHSLYLRERSGLLPADLWLIALSWATMAAFGSFSNSSGVMLDAIAADFASGDLRGQRYEGLEVDVEQTHWPRVGTTGLSAKLRVSRAKVGLKRLGC